jgi:CDP-glucose 4,6-dehydratase
VEDLELSLRPAYTGRRVLVTGHTGFKGSWLCLWLERLGALTSGLALAPDTHPALFHDARVGTGLTDSRLADIRDVAAVGDAVADARPEIIFHLAAQPLVRRGYREPLATFAANIMGTAHLLDAARSCSSLRAMVVVTSDKCYGNPGEHAPFVESDPLGGHDPYSASKACTELVAAAWRDSYWRTPGSPLLATARAGNVIGGGDWAEDRLIPDLALTRTAAR